MSDCDSPLNSKVDGDGLVVLYLAYDAASACELHLRVRKAAQTNNHRNDTATLLVSDPLIPTSTPH